MPTRQELHTLVDTLPEGAIEAAHRILSGMQVWPPAPPSAADMRQNIRQSFGTQTRTANGRPSNSSFQHWEGDTFVTERQHYFKGNQLTIVERIRVEANQLVFKHEITGPGDTHDEREVTFDLAGKHEQ